MSDSITVDSINTESINIDSTHSPRYRVIKH